jgi:FixJ family two-component response regulator
MASPIHIAIVDDDSSMCRTLSRLLRLAHFRPLAYPSAEAFLADERRLRFDCLVLDIRLGSMSGLELLARLAAEQPRLPVIIVTSLDEPALRAQADALGCVGFFSKSAPGSGIVAAIRSATSGAPRTAH